MSTLIHLECSRCGRTYEAGKIHHLCDCGAPLFARYDLAQAKQTMTLDALRDRPASLWRYREVMPVRDERHVVSLGEGFTPLLHAQRLGASLGTPNLYLKDEGLNPTGSFKARGMAAAISVAKELGIRKVAVPSAGNAGGAMAAYAARAGMEARIYVPQGTPLMNRLEYPVFGAKVTLVEGSIKDCARVMREELDLNEWFDVSTLKEPYRVEGKKTMAYEVFEQLGGALPDAMIYPTGGGTGLVGMWKAFDEMQQLGWIGDRRPRMFAVQATGCAPMVRAFNQETERAEEWQNPTTVATGLRVPSAVGDFLILRALRESRGAAIAVTDDALLASTRKLAESEGVLTAPEGGATLAALERLLADGLLSGSESVVLFLTGSGYKYVEVLETLAAD
jgi:threonine synthase